MLKRGEEAILGVVEDMVGGGLQEDARKQAALPFFEGGCGIRVPTHVHGPARIPGKVSHLLDGKKRVGVPDITKSMRPPDLTNVLNDLQATLGATFDPRQGWLKNPDSINITEKEYSRQGWWTKRGDAARKRSLLQKQPVETPHA